MAMKKNQKCEDTKLKAQVISVMLTLQGWGFLASLVRSGFFVQSSHLTVSAMQFSPY